MTKIKVTPELSKEVGHVHRKVAWPEMDQVKQADGVRLLTWYRFLPAAESDKERVILEAITDRLCWNGDCS